MSLRSNNKKGVELYALLLFLKDVIKMNIFKMVILAIVLLVLWIALGVVMYPIPSKPSTDIVSKTSSSTDVVEVSSSHKRFKTIQVENVDNMSWGKLYILEDSYTGDKYLVILNAEGLGITPMVNKEASK